MFIEQFVAERGIERSALPLATNGTQERSQNSRTSIFELNIRELPLNKKETGNTLETRGLTYSYIFLTKPKNAHLECKGIKLFPYSQKVRLLFASSAYEYRITST